jgi:gamma-glutamylcyclotransferase (GGCT)/AIG2-like uncharacterized protein YtfP
MDHLFVYGTLLQYFENTAWSTIKSFVQLEGPGRLTAADLYDLGEYPGLIITGDANQYITGEVYRIYQNIEEVLAALDDYEGDEYRREQHQVELAGQKQIRCWMYVYKHQPQTEHKKIKQGDYLAYIKNKVTNG